MEDNNSDNHGGERKRYRIKKKIRYRLNDSKEKKIKQRLTFAALCIFVVAFVVSLILIVAHIKL